MGLLRNLSEYSTNPPIADLSAGPANSEGCGHALPTPPWLCYNVRAVEQAANLDAGRDALGAHSGEPQHAAEHPIGFCPVCSERLEPKRCKLVCAKCGYYMSCSDYY
ncbi:MAG TPA: hypothetical protein VGT24_06450 [Candidatus Acidoferrales bacterium]|nr:hypothetical protein [Candidatus Acidoferrales bacterium]